MTGSEEYAPTNSVQAAAVRQKMQALFGMIGCKASIGGFSSPPSNPRAQPWTGVGNYQARVWIDGVIQVRSNVDPTFYSLVGSKRSGLSLEHRLRFGLNGENGAPNNASSQTKNYEITLFIMGGMEKAAINRISLIFPSQKEEREILFPFRKD
ncbi:hypothetical protein AMTRI_Chr12g271400 [Amborella trichopoda]